MFCAADLDGHNDVSPSGRGDDPVLAEDEVRFDGEAVFAVVASSHRLARAAAALGEVTSTPKSLSFQLIRRLGNPCL